MLIPLKVGLIGSNGDELPLKLDGGATLSDGLLEVTEREQVFEFRDIPSPPTPSLLRDFSAPGPPHHQSRTREGRVPDDA